MTFWSSPLLLSWAISAENTNLLQSWNMVTLLNAKERTFKEFEKIFSAADMRFKLKQWGEAGGAPSSGKSSLHSTPIGLRKKN